jgi:hypothetical protein
LPPNHRRCDLPRELSHLLVRRDSQERLNASTPAEVHSEIVASTGELLEKGLPSNLIALIQVPHASFIHQVDDDDVLLNVSFQMANVQKNLPLLQADDMPKDISHDRAVLIRQYKTDECTVMADILLAIFFNVRFRT